MTRKDYIAIAALLKFRKPSTDVPEFVLWHGIVWGLADVFAAENPEFRPSVFHTACGL
jgi:hypothetical protein